MLGRARVLASDAVAQEAAEDFLASHGSAVGAVLCGFFASAGAFAGVLWGPISILVGGVGVGARAFDGRLMQPGGGSRRPRGFVDSETVPAAARVAATTAVSAALVAHAYAGGQKLSSILKPGVQRARQSGADARSELLGRVRQVGAAAFAEPRFLRELLRAAGPVQGGLLGSQDFDATRLVIDQPVRESGDSSNRTWSAEWEAEVDEVDPALGHGHAVAAMDVRGVAAVLCYRRVTEGLVLPELELEVPTVAVPVKRGVPRLAPGTRLPAPAPIAIVSGEAGPLEVIAYPSAANLHKIQGVRLSLKRDPLTREVVADKAPTS